MIEPTISLLLKYKSLAEKTFQTLSDEELHLIPETGSNSIPMLVKHLHGNMMSRWTNFLTEDGEKDWRDRDGEFKATLKTRMEMLEKWEEGWECFLNSLQSLNHGDLEKKVFIRGEAHTVIEAILRQVAHYSYHVGQIVYLGKLIKGETWTSLSIPIGKSEEYSRVLTEEQVKAGQFSGNS